MRKDLQTAGHELVVVAPILLVHGAVKKETQHDPTSTNHVS